MDPAQPHGELLPTLLEICEYSSRTPSDHARECGQNSRTFIKELSGRWSEKHEPLVLSAASTITSCARAPAVGVPAVAFTEHLDFTVWTSVEPAPDAPVKVTDLITEDGTPAPPQLDVDGDMACVQRCRERFPDLVILTVVEVGEPHWHRDQVSAVLAAGQFDRVLGSLHTLPLGAGLDEPGEHFARPPSAEVVRDYLAEIARLVAGSTDFEALAHIDFVSRYQPVAAGPSTPRTSRRSSGMR